MTLNFKQTDFFLDEIKNQDLVAFFKPGCPFCSASKDLIQTLKDQNILSKVVIYTLDEDFTNETLLEIVNNFGWKPDGIQQYPTKPQIFVKSQYFGGNSDFYKSTWNLGRNMPNLQNPMRF